MSVLRQYFYLFWPKISLLIKTIKIQIYSRMRYTPTLTGFIGFSPLARALTHPSPKRGRLHGGRHSHPGWWHPGVSTGVWYRVAEHGQTKSGGPERSRVPGVWRSRREQPPNLRGWRLFQPQWQGWSGGGRQPHAGLRNSVVSSGSSQSMAQQERYV
uniref:Uncharacterized protein n=1 Tax=Timema douglasi TaxID=61478 RepID=A0A7R8ZEM8_TIMDO|nr:unnamed protein product [Timema douglasi]